MPAKQEAVIEPLDEAVDHVDGPGTELGLEPARFESDRHGEAALERVRRDVRSGVASGEVRGTPTLFVDGALHRGGYDAETLLEALTR